MPFEPSGQTFAIPVNEDGFVFGVVPGSQAIRIYVADNGNPGAPIAVRLTASSPTNASPDAVVSFPGDGPNAPTDGMLIASLTSEIIPLTAGTNGVGLRCKAGDLALAYVTYGRFY